ncbi:MAG: lipopolysaccharide kinase InaA family protein [Tepidisphaerales bacterium]
MTADGTSASLPPSWGLTPETVFTDPRVRVWRQLPERENAVFETGGQRYHVKRYLRDGRRQLTAELGGLRLLVEAGIPTIAAVSWGELTDGRAYLISRDLGPGWVSGQVHLRGGGRFADVAEVTATLAAKLHAKGLHHRDLYLCHFFVRPGVVARPGYGDAAGQAAPPPARLIDVGRVRRLPGWRVPWPMGPAVWGRWVVKDLAQFVYSLREFDVPAADARLWLQRYEAAGGRAGLWRDERLWRAVHRKAEAIARHDRRLQSRRPGRSVSIPEDWAASGTPRRPRPTDSAEKMRVLP